jgi:glycogen debranching enzyme
MKRTVQTRWLGLLGPLVVGLAIVGHAQAPTPAPAPPAPATIARFVRPPNPIALGGPARPERYMEASGRKAAFLGREDGSFEAWVYPLKVLHDFKLSFGTAAYAAPMTGTSLATTVDVRPEATTVRYSHASFTVDATWLVPLSENGGVVLLDVDTSEPLTVVVQFRVDLKPMWPAALGGQYSYWDDGLKAYVAGEASGKHAALVGSPFSLTPPEQPAHNLPDAPSQFSITITPDTARRGLVPIVIAASTEGLKAATATYQNLMTSTVKHYRESFEHYLRLREEMTSIDTPDDRLDLALEWGKVALDKGFVCNPHLGCGLIAGLGPSGTSERPGFGWFFGGDTFINSWAMTAYGDFDTVKQSLDFLRKRQRADGKMMHELSQGAGYIKWFEEFPYGYYHADTTPLYIIAVRDYVRVSGDVAFAKDMWPSIRKAYEYCASTDEDGDGLMDNTKAGLAAVETGALRRRDVLTDVFLGAVWTEAADAAGELGALAGDVFASTARVVAVKARAALNKRFLDDQNRRIFFAVMKDGKGQSEQTVWPAFGLWRGVFDAGHPAVEGMLDELASAGVGADWGARMLSIDSKLYEPLSYNNGASWPFLTGFAALALYSNGRPDAAWQYLDGMADLTFLESRGYMAELFSGDRLRSVDAAVPHQLFATTGLVSTVLRGLVGLGTAPATTIGNTAVPERMVLAPRLPAGWGWLRIRNLRWRGVTADVAITRDERSYAISVNPKGGTLPLEIRASFGPDTLVDRDAKGRPTSVAGAWKRLASPVAGDRGAALWRFEQVSAPMNAVLPVSPGIEFVPVHKPLASGDSSSRLRIIDAWMDGNVYKVKVEGRRGQSYFARLRVPYPILMLSGAQANTPDGKPAPGPVQELRITMPPLVPLVVNQAGAVVPQDKAASRRSDWSTQIIAVTLAK